MSGMVVDAYIQTIQIKCINKRDRPNPHERITHVGGFTEKPWKITQQDAIEHIEARRWRFWVHPPGAQRSYGSSFR